VGRWKDKTRKWETSPRAAKVAGEWGVSNGVEGEESRDSHAPLTAAFFFFFFFFVYVFRTRMRPR